MTFQAVAATCLLFVSGLLGVKPIAEDTRSWHVIQPWTETVAADGQPQNYMRFEAESNEIPQHCHEHPNEYVAFPAIIHGSHVIRLDGHVVLQFGDPTFETMRSFYGEPVISCKELQAGSTLKWEAYSYTKYFARISFFPEPSPSRPVYNVFAETFHIIGAGAGLLMAIFTFTMFAGKISRPTTLSVCGSSFFSSLYLGGCVAGFMGFPLAMLTVHKIADIGVWISISLLVNALRYEGLVSKKVTWTYIGSVILACVIIILGESGDIVQFGTTIPFMFTLFVLTVPMLFLGRKVMAEKYNRRTLLQFLSLGSFVMAVFNEMFAVTGLIHSSPMLPFGFMAGVMFLALSVNERVNETYFERDFLRNNLENEVRRKTAELQSKTEMLEATMHDLRHTQAELVHSAKLASLGTLSAGIAHEINNSLNYVNGALKPLEKILVSTYQGEDKSKIDRLLVVMKDGLNLTLEIIKSLRNYTGLNQAKFNDVNIKSTVGTTLTILRSKIRDHIEVEVNMPENLQVFGSVVGINQIFMNLVSNSIDAMEKGGRLVIDGHETSNGGVELKIRDTGSGIAAETLPRIFEPFFTTKGVGSGTGLGLHIVRAEVDRHKGTISVESEIGKGTCFTITLPAKGVSDETAPSTGQAVTGERKSA